MATKSLVGNKYWVLRHGRSIPNQTGLIVSSLENGTREEYKLAPEGVNQAHTAGELFLRVEFALAGHTLFHNDMEMEDNKIPLENVRVCYSPFSRTRHTAQVVTSVLNIPFEGPQCMVMEDLRERFFGLTFELESHDKYAEIWAQDEKDPFMKPVGGESVSDVAFRLRSALTLIESQFQGCAILVVSHGDPLQILQTILNAAKNNTTHNGNLASRLDAAKVSSVLSQHRKFALETGELRAVL